MPGRSGRFNCWRKRSSRWALVVVVVAAVVAATFAANVVAVLVFVVDQRFLFFNGAGAGDGGAMVTSGPYVYMCAGETFL